MDKKIVHIFAICASIVSGSCFAAAYSQKFRDQDPYFYAVIAKAAYKHKSADVQKVLDKYLGQGEAKILKRVDFSNDAFGHTNIILVKDNKNRLHVGFEGSTEGRNWLGNAVMAGRGLFSGYDVPHGIRKAMHRIIKGFEKSYPDKTLASLVGHSQGGMFASQVACSHHEHYTKRKDSGRPGQTSVITFNAFKPKSRGNQFHFKTKNEHASSLFSSEKRYIEIDASNNHASVASNHSMKYALIGLKGKKWSDCI